MAKSSFKLEHPLAHSYVAPGEVNNNRLRCKDITRVSYPSGIKLIDHTRIPVMKKIYDFCVKGVNGQGVSLSKYRGNVSLIVNVASLSEYTNCNYRELTILHQKYKHQGFEILAFPCNQFGLKEPMSDEEIQEFVCTLFKPEFPIFSKINVNGRDADPLYKFLKARIGESTSSARIKDNFTKFLVNRKGKVIRRYAPNINPLSIENDIKKLLVEYKKGD